MTYVSLSPGTVRKLAILALSGALCTCFAARFLSAQAPRHLQRTQKGLMYWTTWIGASWPGGPEWVQTTISALCVLPDGTLVTASSWDEAHRENTVYSHDGAIVAGVSSSQSRAIGADAKYVYARVNRKVAGRPMQGIARYHLSRYREKEGPTGKYGTRWCEPAPFPGGNGPERNELYIAEAVPYFTGPRRRQEIAANPAAAEKYLHARPQITGIASNGTYLFVAEDLTHHIHVFECESMKLVRRIPFRYPGAIAATPAGTVWVIKRPDHPRGVAPWMEWAEEGEHAVVELTTSGQPTGRSLHQAQLPTAVAISPDGRYLLVADSHPERLQILIYDISVPTPRLVRTFGDPGGVYAAPKPGLRGPNRLNYLSGVGMDEHGCLFASSRAPSGTWLRRYTPEGALAWERYSATFMNGAAVVPGTPGTHVFTGRGGSNFLIVDYARTTGPLDRWTAVTWDPYRYPEDIRKHGFRLQRLPNGRLYLLLGVETGTLVLREEPASHIFVPSLFLAGGQYHGDPDRYPPYHPGKHRFMWRDVNGNGRIDPDEYVFIGPHHNARQWQIDSRGDLWEHDNAGLVRHRLKGFDAHGNPLYDFTLHRQVGVDPRGRPRYAIDTERVDLFRRPPPFDPNIAHQSIKEFIYDADRDTMFLFGFPADMPQELRNDWSVGSVAVRYDHFTTNPTLVSRIELPYGDPDEKGRKPDPGNVIRSVAVADDLLFAARTRTNDEGQVWVYNTRTGDFLGVLKPGPELWGETSLVDIREAVHAFRRPDGEYVVFVENNWKNLQIVYRIPPQPLTAKALQAPGHTH